MPRYGKPSARSFNQYHVIAFRVVPLESDLPDSSHKVVSRDYWEAAHFTAISSAAMSI
jgi:hypothetical protein